MRAAPDGVELHPPQGDFKDVEKAAYRQATAEFPREEAQEFVISKPTIDGWDVIGTDDVVPAGLEEEAPMEGVGYAISTFAAKSIERDQAQPVNILTTLKEASAQGHCKMCYDAFGLQKEFEDMVEREHPHLKYLGMQIMGIPSAALAVNIALVVSNVIYTFCLVFLVCRLYLIGSEEELPQKYIQYMNGFHWDFTLCTMLLSMVNTACYMLTRWTYNVHLRGVQRATAQMIQFEVSNVISKEAEDDFYTFIYCLKTFCDISDDLKVGHLRRTYHRFQNAIQTIGEVNLDPDTTEQMLLPQTILETEVPRENWVVTLGEVEYELPIPNYWKIVKEKLRNHQEKLPNCMARLVEDDELDDLEGNNGKLLDQAKRASFAGPPDGSQIEPDDITFWPVNKRVAEITVIQRFMLLSTLVDIPTMLCTFVALVLVITVLVTRYRPHGHYIGLASPIQLMNNPFTSLGREGLLYAVASVFVNTIGWIYLVLISRAKFKFVTLSPIFTNIASANVEFANELIDLVWIKTVILPLAPFVGGLHSTYTPRTLHEDASKYADTVREEMRRFEEKNEKSRVLGVTERDGVEYRFKMVQREKNAMEYSWEAGEVEGGAPYEKVLDDSDEEPEEETPPAVEARRVEETTVEKKKSPGGLCVCCSVPDVEDEVPVKGAREATDGVDSQTVGEDDMNKGIEEKYHSQTGCLKPCCIVEDNETLGVTSLASPLVIKEMCSKDQGQRKLSERAEYGTARDAKSEIISSHNENEKCATSDHLHKPSPRKSSRAKVYSKQSSFASFSSDQPENKKYSNHRIPSRDRD